jgi:ribosome biogenesis protein BRX1
MLDLVALMPHCKKDVKLDTKDEREVINEVAELHGCSSALFFESRKHQDLYLWLAKTPAGPSVKFHVTNVHTMGELSLPGNHLKGSRPVLRFDASFDDAPHGPLLREMLMQVFVTPRGHRKSKPFMDHVLLFGFQDGRVWFRNYAAHFPPGKPSTSAQEPHGGATLVEVGPRMTLNPIRVFAGSFRGAVLWSNPDYVSPNAVRRRQKQQLGGAYARKVAKKQARKAHAQKWESHPDELDNERVFKQ